MKRIILITFFLSLFLMEIASAQNRFGFSFGGGYISSALDRTKLPYWENGYSINFSSDYMLTDKIALFFSSSFQKHYFTTAPIPLVVPAVVGYRYSVSGENSSVIELSVGGKVYMAETMIKPYLGIGTGFLLINQGKIKITTWMVGNPNRTTHLYSGSDKYYNIAQFNVGLGLEAALINNFQLVLEGKMIYGFGGPLYFPITASIKFGI